MALQEKTLAELAQGDTGFATLKVNEKWQTGIVFDNGGKKFFASIEPPGTNIALVVRSYRILNNGVKVGSELLALPASDLKALLSEAGNG